MRAELVALQQRLHAASTVAEVQARATVEACGFCGFERAAVLGVQDGRLAPQAEVAVAEPACDALRLRALSRPQRIVRDSEEFELIRRLEHIGRPRPARRSVLQEALELQEYLLVPVMPEARVVALIVLDRAGPAVGAADHDRAGLFAHLFGLALERTVLRTRLAEVSTEIRHLTASATALAQEALSAPITPSTDLGWGAVFPMVDSGDPAARLRDVLTEREMEIVALMVKGLSNPAIARELHLSPDTVKAHVARLLRKLGVRNRTEAVAAVLAL